MVGLHSDDAMQLAATCNSGVTHSDRALRRFMECERTPLFIANWERALFLHFELPPRQLQSRVPFELDLFDGAAYVSLVAFTMREMRLARLGRAGRWLFAPISEQRFLNLRTYVRCGTETGIYFISEWISNGWCVPFGPVTYGLPYHWGRLDYEHHPERNRLTGRVESRRDGSCLQYQALHPGPAAPWNSATVEPGSLDEFLVERYIACTQQGRRQRQFRIWHESWKLSEVRVRLVDDSLVRTRFEWWPEARLVRAHYSPGVSGVWLGKPRRL